MSAVHTANSTPPEEKKQPRFTPVGGDSENNTLAEPEHAETMQGMPPVDWDKAENIQPSRLRGKGLTFMVTVIAGTGVSARSARRGAGCLTL
jgi:hypothetical protein